MCFYNDDLAFVVEGPDWDMMTVPRGVKRTDLHVTVNFKATLVYCGICHSYSAAAASLHGR